MSKTIIFKAFLASSLMAAAVLAPGLVSASEGARSVGKGIKCSQRVVLQADGTYKLQQVCYKGI